MRSATRKCMPIDWTLHAASKHVRFEFRMPLVLVLKLHVRLCSIQRHSLSSEIGSTTCSTNSAQRATADKWYNNRSRV